MNNNMEHRFEVDSELKEEFLLQKIKDTARTEYYVLKSADKFEMLLEKPIYYMSYIELRDLLITQFQNSSYLTVSKNVSILRKYIDFCIEKNVVGFVENRLIVFTKEKLKDLVNHQIMKDKYVSKEKLKEYQNQLYNPQDQAILELPFVGIKGEGLQEIINLKLKDIDEKRGFIYAEDSKNKKRVVEVNQDIIQLLKDVYWEDLYVENNGMETENTRLHNKVRKTKVNKCKDYIFRTPGKNKFKPISVYVLRSRMSKIQDYVGNYHLSFNSLYFSGMIDKAKEIHEEKGELNKEDYINICNQFAYYSDEDGESQYWSKVKNLVEDFYLNDHTK